MLDPFAGGSMAYFESVSVVQSPAAALRKWTRYDVVYTLARGPERRASTFRGSLGRLAAGLAGGERVCVWTEQRGSYLNITNLVLAPEDGAEDSDEAGEAAGC